MLMKDTTHNRLTDVGIYSLHTTFYAKITNIQFKQEGHDGPVSLHWLIREIHSYQTLHYLGIGLKHKTPYKD